MAADPDPATEREMYLDERSHNLADATIQSHRSLLEQFVQWCDQVDIENLTESSGRAVSRFHVKRRNDDELATTTEQSRRSGSASTKLLRR